MNRRRWSLLFTGELLTRESEESSIAGGADMDIRPVEGGFGEDTGADAGTGLAEGGEEAVARFSLYETGRGAEREKKTWGGGGG